MAKWRGLEGDGAPPRSFSPDQFRSMIVKAFSMMVRVTQTCENLDLPGSGNEIDGAAYTNRAQSTRDPPSSKRHGKRRATAGRPGFPVFARDTQKKCRDRCNGGSSDDGHTHTHTRTHARTHTHKHTRTHTRFLHWQIPCLWRPLFRDDGHQSNEGQRACQCWRHRTALKWAGLTMPGESLDDSLLTWTGIPARRLRPEESRSNLASRNPGPSQRAHQLF